MNRRRFFQLLSSVASMAVAAFLTIPGVGFLLDPLSRRGTKAKSYPLVKLGDLKAGLPRKIVITDQRTDAWTRYPEGAIGAVWIVRGDDGQVTAFSSICPHLGCQVHYVPADDEYFCPCHTATYFADGAVGEGPQLRGLDTLKTEIKSFKGDDWVHVTYEKFKRATEEKIPLA